jgi:hypothetical protein
LTGDAENVVSIDNALLISKGTAEQRLQEVSQIVSKRNLSRLNIIDTASEPSTSVGDVVGYEIEDGEQREGFITKQTYSYGGGMLVKDSEVIA